MKHAKGLTAYLSAVAIVASVGAIFSPAPAFKSLCTHVQRDQIVSIETVIIPAHKPTVPRPASAGIWLPSVKYSNRLLTCDGMNDQELATLPSQQRNVCRAVLSRGEI